MLTKLLIFKEMNKLLILLLSGLIQLSGFSQRSESIKISKDIELIRISEHAIVHVSYSELPGIGRFPSNGLIYLDRGKGYLFDTPISDSLTRELVNWIIDSLRTEIIGFVPNHWHNDCMGGLNYLQSIGIDSYANQMTIDIAKSKGLPLPSHGFKDSLTLTLNGKSIRCYYLGAAHSLDNIVVWIPDERILFAGCMSKDFNANGLGNAADGDLKEWPMTIDRVIDKFPSAKIVIPGHGQLGGLELLKHTKELLAK
jgi:metallo-beta-lactamase class B